MPIVDANNKIQSYIQLKIEKPYIALNDETYISIHSQELNTCKRIGYEYFCEELFVERASTDVVVPAQCISILTMTSRKIVIFTIITTGQMLHHLC